jgi:hypothetical protein
MRSVASRRSLDKIVDDILEVLKPLQPETVRPALMEVARNTQFMGPRIRKIASRPAIKKRAEKALRALDALVEVYGYLGDGEQFHYVRTMIELLTQLTKAPHPNTDVRQRALVGLAASLVAQYSPRGISTSKDGNLHATAKCLYEISTGQRATPAQMLDAVWKAFPPE